MAWMVKQQVTRGRRSLIWGVALLCWLFIMFVTPKIPLSHRNHLYADMCNFLDDDCIFLTFSSFILERLRERIRLSCVFSLLLLAVLSASYARLGENKECPSLRIRSG